MLRDQYYINAENWKRMEGNRNHDSDENADVMSGDATNRKFPPAEPLPLGSSKQKCKSRAMHGVCGSFLVHSVSHSFLDNDAHIAAYDAPSNDGKKRKSVRSHAANAASWTGRA
jgi:hypothetical protein